MIVPPELTIKIFSDGADIAAMKQVYREGVVKGFTTNPTLMKKAGVQDYRRFARDVLGEIRDLPISFEVFSDDFGQMEVEAREIARWGANVNVKIPITNTRGESALPLVRRLSGDGVPLNITALLTLRQVQEVVQALAPGAPAIISVFVGRIADTGRDPLPVMKEAAAVVAARPGTELLWASSRELLNIFQAQECGCHIITVTSDILKKMSLIGKDLEQLSRETVQMLTNDARALGYSIL